MNLEYSDAQRILADMLERLLVNARSYDDRRTLVAQHAWGDSALWSALAETGCFALMVSEDAGGLGGKAIDLVVMARALGRHLVIEPVREAVCAGILLGRASGGDAELDALIAGTLRYCVLDTEAGGGDLVHGAWGADGLLLVQNDSLALIDGTGLALSPVQLFDDTMAADVTFDASSARKFDVGSDWLEVRAFAAACSRLFLCCETLGSMEAALAQTSAYVSERRQFGRAIAEFQVVQHRVAEMVVAVKEAEAVALLAALTIDSAGPGDAADRALAAATSRIAAAAALVAESAVQLHGGMGVSDETPVAAHFRKLQAFRLLAGSMDDVADAMVKTGAHHRSAALSEA